MFELWYDMRKYIMRAGAGQRSSELEEEGEKKKLRRVEVVRLQTKINGR